MPTDARERSVHDLGGVTGYGPVPHDPAEPPFHADWEKRVFGLLGAVTSATARRPGEFRYVLERLDPADYFDHGYYGRWLAGFEVLLAEYGVIGAPAMTSQVTARTEVPAPEAAEASPVQRAAPAAVLNPALLPPDRPTPTPQRRTVRRELSDPPRFSIGDQVVALGPAQPGHTRLPDYAVGKLGTVAKLHPAEVLPDSTAHDMGERPQHVYCVGYDAQTLWGDEAEPNTTIHVDLYECYLQAAPTQD